MIEIEKTLLDALIELEKVVDGMAAATLKPNLGLLFSHIDDLTGQLPASTNPTLLHYLHKKSYQKARLYLQGEDAENQKGSCRHV